MKTVVFFGYSGSGKTRAIVSVAKELVKKGNKVGTIKHIHDEDFTMDTKGKDTWLHASAGASVIVALAPNELTTIEKKDTRNMTIDELLRIFRSKGVDYLVIEGLYRKLSKSHDIVPILCAKSSEDAVALLGLHPRPVCILHRNPGGARYLRGVPLLRLPKDLGRLLELIG